MRLRSEDLMEFKKEDAELIHAYMKRNKITNMKQFALICDVPYQSIQACLKSSSVGGKTRMLKESFNKIRLQLNRTIRADLVDDGINKLRRRIAYEIFLARDGGHYEREMAFKDVYEWLKTFLGEERYAKDERFNTRATNKNANVHQSQE